MTKLKSLKDRLEKLPETKKLKGLIGSMEQYQTKLKEAAVAFDTAERNENNANAVLGEEQVAIVESERRKVARIAKMLAAKLREDIQSVNYPRTKVNEAVTDISELAAKAGRDVRTKWQSLIDQKVKPYDKLVVVARKLKLEGADELAAVMDLLRAARDTVPGNTERVNAVAKQVQNLPTAVQKLDLNDPAVQQFIEDAASGTAKLKSFADNQSVSDFIQKHKLWDLFRVRII
ncbi:hypothetical protein [Tuwongella immobilis]|uniref:Uncharacterized protein n=1 Tax=Tuwongella immobilis TaxID=692036 RepID=A0A6C2YVY7_9BACT|nr:hypothetical protein [Tuwongella immobilis]VIP05333.1 Uncharacterized protein OS=Sinorhizobium fredii USDA 257 GN=USDA257_c04370 PE=4 SV=1 [Tuwongella immobilis]VTS08022.1 Uncharacterized protein OS=Sinorhizobium fredii USDA 257 GN=USDA257_c04370 PE=4 SV=1 [Tuwongella immobilis]